jgi:cytochrome c nitrite reductase small subunit
MPAADGLNKVFLLYAFALIAICIPLGLGAFTFVYGEGHAYLSSDPSVCVKCHIMSDQFNAWKMGDHASRAKCNDCHLPDGAISKLVSKASNGYFHSLAFTTGGFADPIRIKPHNKAIVENSCKRCHSTMVHVSNFPGSQLEWTSCLHCHSGVGHGRKN